MSEFATHWYFNGSWDLLLVLCFKTQFEVLIFHINMILAYCIGNVMSTGYLLGAEKSLVFLSKLKAENRIFVRRRRQKLSSKTCLLFLSQPAMVRWHHHTQQALITRSRDERRRGAGSQVSKTHFYTQTWSWYMWKERKFHRSSTHCVVFRCELQRICSYND